MPDKDARLKAWLDGAEDARLCIEKLGMTYTGSNSTASVPVFQPSVSGGTITVETADAGEADEDVDIELGGKKHVPDDPDAVLDNATVLNDSDSDIG